MKKHFIVIVDSYASDTLTADLQSLGLTKSDYDVTGVGGAKWIDEDITTGHCKAENVLVFMSSFHGSIEEAVAVATKAKAAKPGTRIIFRSSELRQNLDPIFDDQLSKGNRDKFLSIVREFLTDDKSIKSK